MNIYLKKENKWSIEYTAHIFSKLLLFKFEYENIRQEEYCFFNLLQVIL